MGDGSDNTCASVRAVSLEDTVGLKARAWHDRFVIRDIIDLHAVGGAFSLPATKPQMTHDSASAVRAGFVAEDHHVVASWVDRSDFLNHDVAGPIMIEVRAVRE